MAIYVKTFGTDTAGQPPAGMTRRILQTVDWLVVDDATAFEGKAVRVPTVGPSSNRALSLDVVDADVDRANSEVLIRARNSVVSDQTDIGGTIRGTDSPSVQLYRGVARNPQIALMDAMISGTYTTLNGGQAYTNAPLMAVNEWFYVRFRANANALDLKVWPVSVSEPAAWQSSDLDSQVTAPGYVGIMTFRVAQQDLDIDYVAVATAGDTAPLPASVPVLATPTAQNNGETAFTGTVSSDQSAGTLYFVATTSATPPTDTQIKAGQNGAGAAAPSSGNQAITASGTQNVSGSGLTASTTYYVHYISNTGGVDSNISSSTSFTTDAVAGPAPSLSAATAQANGANGFTGTVDSVGAEGTLYCIVSESAIKPTITQMKSGLDYFGNPAAFAGSQAITTAGVQNVSGNGLTASTTYHTHYVATANSQDSLRITAFEFTTEAEASASLPTPTALTTTNITAAGAKFSLNRGQ